MMTIRRPTKIEKVLHAAFWISIGLLIATLTIGIAKADEPVAESLDAKIARAWAPTSDVRILGNFCVSEDAQKKSARYVVEYFNADVPSQTDRHSGFRTDQDSLPESRPVDDDYQNSGFDRGHLAASANHLSSETANRATFSLINVAPQNPGLNRGAWKRLEALIRDVSKRPSIIITVPLYLPDESGELRIQTIGSGRVWVPTHFGKAWLNHDQQGAVHVAHWIIPNADIGNANLHDYRVTGDAFEAASGLDLWAPLPDELEFRLEAELP